MNHYIKAIRSLDLDSIQAMIEKDPSWLKWEEPDGKNALHYLLSLRPGENKKLAADILTILKFLLKKSMDMNSVHRIPEKGGFFRATPVWYAYTRGCNELAYKWLLQQGADPERCMFAIAWYDDPAAAALFKRHGAKITDEKGEDQPFFAAFMWKKFKAAEWFLDNGADVNCRDKNGNTVLLLALKRKFDLEWIEFLLKRGADPNIENHLGISPKKMVGKGKQKKLKQVFGL